MKIPPKLKQFLEASDLDAAKQLWRYLEQDDTATDEMIDIIAESHGMRGQCSPDDAMTLDEWGKIETPKCHLTP